MRPTSLDVGLTGLRPAETVFVIPCSSGKRTGGVPRAEGPRIVERLSAPLATELTDRRRQNAAAARLDESRWLPAIDRYTGMLYRTGDFGLRTLLDRGAEVVIISGGYGLVLAQEPIGWYEAVLEPAAWPNRLVERCLAAYVQSTGARNVVGILAATSSYAHVFRRTPWTAGTQVFLVSPRSPGGRIGGAMVKVPRAQGEALDELGSSGRLLPEWRSSDGLMMEVTRVQ